MTIEASTRVSRTPDLMATAIDDELVILNMATNSYIALDAVARRVWELMETPARVDELCDQLESEFEAPEGQIPRDVVVLLQEMLRDGLVRSQPQSHVAT
jgi:hypothetical protein